ncbi:MAG: M28 family peptidase [Myxococcota bacterium]
MLVTRIEPDKRRPPAHDRPLAGTLRTHVEAFAIPRDVFRQPGANAEVRERLADLLSGFGYHVSIQGDHRNVVALPADLSEPVPLVCAHLDSVATTPGADDNASGLAVLVETARASARAGVPVAFLAPNAEEHNLAGSREFVAAHGRDPSFAIRAAHVLEMVGFTSSRPGSQTMPANIPARGLDVGDFLGLAANHRSMPELKRVLRSARSLRGVPRVVALRAYFGMERLVPDIYRSDHAPFWWAGLPAVLWTDTAEFRNPHYHDRGDTPDTLNYAFMAQVTALLLRSLGVGAAETGRC